MCLNFQLAYEYGCMLKIRGSSGKQRPLAHVHYLLTLPATFSSILYSPDLAQNDFHSFTHLKQFLGGTRMRSHEGVKKTVTDWFSGLAADLYRNSSRDTNV
jgi:hypothetical protein